MNVRRLMVAVTLGVLFVFAAQVATVPDATGAQSRTLSTLPELPPPPLPTPVYTDVDASTPYRTAILALSRYGIMTGYGDGTVGPNNPLLRAQFAKMFYELNAAWFGSRVTESTPYPFWDLGPDNPTSLYPHEYVGAVAAMGLMLGYPDGRFRPYIAISRAQVVTSVVRWGRAHWNPFFGAPTGFRGALGNFDATHASNMAVAEYSGLLRGLEGYGPTWDPWAKMTRGEAAQVLWNLLGQPLP